MIKLYTISGEGVKTMKRIGTFILSAIMFTSSMGSAFASESVVKLGDINGDGKVSSIDLLLMKKYILGDGTVQNADMNGDGRINSVDLLLLKKRILTDDTGIIDAITFGSPAGILKQGVETEIEFSAIDQSGKQLISDTDLGLTEDNQTKAAEQTLSKAKFSVTGGVVRFVVDSANDNKVKMMITPNSDATVVTISVITETPKVSTKSYSVQTAPIPKAVKGFSADFIPAMQIGQTQKFDDDLLFIDQFGEELRLPTGYSISLKAVSGEGSVTSNVASATTTYSAAALKDITFTATTAGSTTYEISLIKDSDNSLVYRYKFTMEAVREDDITGYTVVAPEKIYTGPYYTPEGLKGEWKPRNVGTITVKGLSGVKEVLVPQNVIKAAAIDVQNIAAIVTSVTPGTIQVVEPIDTEALDKECRLTVIVADKNGNYVVDKKITYTSAAPVANTIKVLKESDDSEVTDEVYYISSKDDINGVSANDLTPSAKGKGIYFSIKDQYNAPLNYGNTFIVTKVSPGADVKVDSKSGKITVTTLNTGDSFSYSVISNGQVKTIRIIVGG